MATHSFTTSLLESQFELVRSGCVFAESILVWQVYEAFFLMATRDFKAAAELFLDSIATFTTCELPSEFPALRSPPTSAASSSLLCRAIATWCEMFAQHSSSQPDAPSSNRSHSAAG